MRKDVLVAALTEDLVVITPMLLLPSPLTNQTRSPVYQLGSRSGTGSRARKVVVRPQLSNRSWPNSINDNYCVKCVTGLKDFVDVSGKLESLNPPPVLAGKKDLSVTTKRETENSHVNSYVVNPVHFVKGYLQKKGVNPANCQNYTEIKYVKDVSCVGHLSSVNLVTNVPTVASDLPVGARLHQFWEKWAALGASPKVVTVLREGYTLPFRFRPNLTRSPTIISYVNPNKKSYLLEALHQLLNKNAVKPVTIQKPLA